MSLKREMKKKWRSMDALFRSGSKENLSGLLRGSRENLSSISGSREKIDKIGRPCSTEKLTDLDYNHNSPRSNRSFKFRLGSLSNVKEDPGSQRRDEGGGSEKDLSNGGYIQRCVIIQRDDKGYGLTVRGDNPVYVESVKADGAAARAGVQQGDRIVKVNGTLVTNSNHIDVVKLIKSGSFVALTLLNKPPTGGGTVPASDQPPGVSRRVTAPLPVDDRKSKELAVSKLTELKRYYDLALEDLQQIKKEYNRNPSAKLGSQIVDKEKTVKKLEEQLKVLTPSVTSLSHVQHSDSAPELGQLDQQPVTSWLPSGPLHVKHRSTPASFNNKLNAGVSRSMSDAGTRRTKLQLPRHHYSIKSADISPEPTTTLDGGNTSESPTISPSSSPTPIHARNLTIQSEDNDSVSSGTTKDSGYDECSQVGSLGGSGKAQQDIIAMEDDEFSDEEPSGIYMERRKSSNSNASHFLTRLQNLEVNNGAFSSLKLLESRPPHLAVFLNYVMTMSLDPSSLLFYIVSGYYRTTPGTCKELKKWAFEIYSTFLVAAGSPLKLNVDESISVEIDNILVYRNDKEDILRKVFDHARLSVQTELQNMLQEFCAKKEIGFASMFGAHELKDIMKKNEEIAVVEKYVMPHLDRCFRGDGGEDAIKSERELAMGWALNTFLRNVGVNRHNSSMDRVQSFIAKDKRLLKIGQQKKKKVNTVQQHEFQLKHYYKVEKCIHCDKVIWGVGYQAYYCQGCEMSVHKTCIDDLDEPCKRQRGKSKFRNFRPTSTAGGNALGGVVKMVIPDLLTTALKGKEMKGEEQSESYPPPADKTDTLSPSPNQNTSFNIEPPNDEDKPEHSVNRLVQNFEDLQGDKRRSPGLEPTEPQKYVIGKNPPKRNSGLSRSQSFLYVKNMKGSDLGRSESMKSRGDSKGDRPARRAKRKLSAGDVDVDENLTRVLNSGSSSTSSLKSADSPSTSVEAVNNIPQSVDNDSDFEVESELPPLKEVLSEEVYRKLKPKERKRQEVINELFYTEKTHVKNLKILEMLFYKPMINDNVNENLTKALFPNIEDILKLHTSLNDEMKKKRKENPVVGDVADILVKRFDAEEGEAFRNGCAIYCRNQSHALESLRSRQKKDNRLSSFLAAAESSNLMRRLQLKDLIPTQMMRLTKYPLLIESLMKYTSAQSEEHAKLERALQCSKHILEYVNQAVKEYENHYKLEHLQRKVEKKLDGLATDDCDYKKIKELDLTKHKLVYDGVLTWNINQRKTVDVHVVLLEDVLVLLQKQDEKLVLKFQSTQLVAGKDDSRYMFSPLLELSSVLAANSKATDKKAFFVVAKSQIYELSAHTGEEQKKWIKLIKESADSHKRNKSTANQLRPSTSPGRLEEEKGPRRIFSSDMMAQADVTQEPLLEQPDKIIVSSPVTSVAEPVLTPLERARRLDEAVKENLEEKRRLVAEIINDVDERDRLEQIPVSPETESLHNTIQEAMEECSSFIIEICDRESGLMQENIQMPIPMDKLKEMANRMNQILTNLLEKTRAYHALRAAGQDSSGAVVGNRDEERERLRMELKAAQDELNMLREIQRKVSSTSPPDIVAPLESVKRERPQSLVSETSTLSSDDGTPQQREEAESDSTEDIQMMEESTELIEPEVAIATEIPQCIDTSDFQEIEPSDEETIEDLDAPQIPENDLILDAEVLHISNVQTESELVEEVLDLDSLSNDNKQELDSINEEVKIKDNTTNESCDIPKEFHDSDHKSLNDDVSTDVDDTNSDSETISNQPDIETERKEESRPEQTTEESSDNDFEKIEKSEIPKSDESEMHGETQDSKSENISKETDETKEQIQEQNDKSQENNTVTESESRLNGESSKMSDTEKSEADNNENIEKSTDANISDSQTIEPSS
ncbi:rho guanine nucleotide exchange factor 12-like isoform X6 [Mytilus californianus]|uniref:rho guanine nucleotide exchange factor 12-like isoform X6 n=1 Tax=Mytilus californianus TaxID=6549 RepID=UPI0022481FC9|nr:rho guanine nucleotide exchange factor 12-like isoform X6 [Mytilus californianus]